MSPHAHRPPDAGATHQHANSCSVCPRALAAFLSCMRVLRSNNKSVRQHIHQQNTRDQEKSASCSQKVKTVSGTLVTAVGPGGSTESELPLGCWSCHCRSLSLHFPVLHRGDSPVNGIRAGLPALEGSWQPAYWAAPASLWVPGRCESTSLTFGLQTNSPKINPPIGNCCQAMENDFSNL